MRIVVSGSHASGKSTLISDFALRHPEYTVLPDPFELIEESADSPGPAMFSAQLRIAATRLLEDPRPHLIAERGPIDFLAYVLALGELADEPAPVGVIERLTATTATALAAVDLLVVLPLSGREAFHIGAEEHPELRLAMNDALLDLLEDPDATGGVAVTEVTGTPAERLAALEGLVAGR